MDECPLCELPYSQCAHGRQLDQPGTRLPADSDLVWTISDENRDGKRKFHREPACAGIQVSQTSASERTRFSALVSMRSRPDSSDAAYRLVGRVDISNWVRLATAN